MMFPFDALAAAIALIVLVVVLLWGARLHRLRILAEQALAAQRGETEMLRAAIADTERGLGAGLDAALSRTRQETAAAIGEMRASLDTKLRELRENNDLMIDQLRRSVNEQLHGAIEQQFAASFARVGDQMTALQRAMGDVQAVTGQIGDLRRLFSNVKSRGIWGETQLRALLDDALPAGAYVENWRPRADSAEVVEFALAMPVRGEHRPYLPIDAKFPVEDYERLLLAAEAGDAEAEKSARAALDRAVRAQARRIAEKYIAPPATADFAVMYLPTDGLYTEVARIPGLLDDLGRGQQRILVLGPSLFPALLHTIHLGHVTLTLEVKAEQVRGLLGATRHEMQKMLDALGALDKQVGTVANSVRKAMTRARAVDRKLRDVTTLDAEAAAGLLGAPEDDEETPEP